MKHETYHFSSCEIYYVYSMNQWLYKLGIAKREFGILKNYTEVAGEIDMRTLIYS